MLSEKIKMSSIHNHNKGEIFLLHQGVEEGRILLGALVELLIVNTDSQLIISFGNIYTWSKPWTGTLDNNPMDHWVHSTPPNDIRIKKRMLKNLGLYQSNMTWLTSKKGIQYHWLLDLFH